MDRLTANQFLQADDIEDWRIFDGRASAWFDAPSLTHGAELVRRIAELAGVDAQPDVDLRPMGVRVRIGTPGAAGLTSADMTLARGISAAARDLGLTADPAALQVIGLTIDTVDQPALMPFWRAVLAYEPAEDGSLRDPSRRDPTLTFSDLGAPRPLRSRIHLDVVRTPEAVAEVKTEVGRESFGAFGVALADDDGNEVDLVPGDQLTEGAVTTDWRVVFSAMASYRVISAAQASELASVVAGLADEAGLPMLVDLRPSGVTLDSGKDQWEDDAYAADTTFVELAGRIQDAARGVALVADPSPLRFVQLGLDAVDVPSVRAFWATLLGYQYDPRTGVTDIYDPRRLNPVIIFQEMDPTETDRREQRNRLRFELAVPHDQIRARIDTAVAAGGRVLTDETPDRCRIADPEGNELDLVSTS